ncbi:MAG: formyl transferase [Hyphomicrobiales bacterium]|nr:formyl transferase [Hyphomicrobiales bacterium]MCP4997384.1 formyl transferase [Hyphomicrobiales bacterium]
MEKHKILAITAGGPYPWVIINALADKFGPVTVVHEQPESKAHFLKRRAAKLGYVSTAGQFATMMVSRLSKTVARQRELQIIEENSLEIAPASNQKIISVGSANDSDCIELIACESPDVVFLAGCRMLSRKTLQAIKAPVINYHAGINPKYRGMLGGYWAQLNGDLENFGTTVHLVDEGVDTGAILYQARMQPSRLDSIATYAMIQAAHSREICISAVRDVVAGKARPISSDLPSNQWYHPPIWAYVWHGITRGIW